MFLIDFNIFGLLIEKKVYELLGYVDRMVGDYRAQPVQTTFPIGPNSVSRDALSTV